MPRHPQSEVDQSRVPLLRRLMNNNSGAAIALMDLLHCGRRFGEPVSEEVEWCLTMLDTLGICGDNLDIFWGDVCCRSLEEMSLLLRACHEGCNGVSRDTIGRAIACCRQETATFGELQSVSEVPGL